MPRQDNDTPPPNGCPSFIHCNSLVVVVGGLQSLHSASPLKPTWGSAQVKLPTRCHSSLVFLTCFLVFLPFVFAHPVRFLSLPPRCSCVSAVCSFPKPPVLLAFSPLLFSPLHPSIAERSHYRVSPDRQKES
ncbi:hypothetical protein DTO166G4_572 [Paecilomyces variotii]|nr:hypothetical protein DTO166G4_572 [Paecilomyces variotii]KAJ9221943.1 hypothetical protein DTO169C6_5737 [Paecilomyces variotii]